jgi:nucleoside-diphosphate-sugar epimerase
MGDIDKEPPLRVLITGGAGFVAPFVVAALHAVRPHGIEIVATAQAAGNRTGVGA